MNRDLFTEPLFTPIILGQFRNRINRFVVDCLVAGKPTRAYLPNPGRLWELLLPHYPLYLIPNSPHARTYPYTVVAVKKEEHVVLLHTHQANTVAQYLLHQGKIPGLEGAVITDREVKMGHHRFDFQLRQGDQTILLEVKSCTLFGTRLAMFPDAVTIRGKEHINHLAALSSARLTGAILFVVSTAHVPYFFPNYHRDLEFARTLLAARERLLICAIGCSWREDLTLREIKPLSIPWTELTQEISDQGCYLLILTIEAPNEVTIGALGHMKVRPGYYIYVGSARRHLSSRLAHHQRISRRPFWHIDYLRPAASTVLPIPIRTTLNWEHELAQDLATIASPAMPRFGASDCTCPTHLFFMEENPLQNRSFLDLLCYYHMDRRSLP